MGGPWEDYAAPAQDGPWADYKSTAKASASQPKRSLTQDVTGFMANVNRHLGVGDELAAGIKTARDVVTGNSGPDIGHTFRDEMAGQRQQENAFAVAHPHVAALAKGTGDAALVAVPGGKAANAFNMPVTVMNRAVPMVVANAARGATTAGLTGAAYAAADAGTPQERAQGAARAAHDPVTLALGGALGAATTTRVPMAKPKPVNADQLKAQKTAAYAAADQAGVTYAPAFVGNMISGIEQDLAKVRLNPARHPKAASMLDDIRGLAGQSPTLTELDQLRQVVSRDVASATDKAERFMGKRIITQIDKHLDGAGPADVVAGSATDAAALIKNARDLNTRYRKVTDVQDAVTKAEMRAGSTGSGGNADNAIRQNLRRVLEKGQNFTDEEAQSLEQIVMGGKGQNLLRLVGKLSPSGNGLMAAGNLASAAALGPLGAIPGAAGIVAKLKADAMTRQNVTRLVQMMANGGKALAPVATGPAASRLAPEVAAKLNRAAAISGGQRAYEPQNAFARP